MGKRKVLFVFLSSLMLALMFNTGITAVHPLQSFQASKTLSHKIPLDIVFVGYNEQAIDMTTLDSIITKYYTMPYTEWTFEYQFNVNYVFANQTYLQALTMFILQNSVVGTNTTSKLNATALQYQRTTGTKMPIFLPQSGRAIDAMAVEDWFATHPYAVPSTPRYTFYMLNYTEFDSYDHSLEHWYNLTEPEHDANTTRDFWRLEWDNALNPHVGFPYSAFSDRHPLFFIDPSAFNWYLTWARIWWRLDSHLANPKYDYYFEDLDTFQQTHDLSTTHGKTALGYYLGGWIDDILSNNLAPSVWPSPTASLSLQVLVLNNASQYGYTNDRMKWILNTSLVKNAVEQLAPFIPTDVSVKFANLSDYPDVNALLKNSIIRVQNGWTYVDGYSLFYGLESLREQHFDYSKAEWVVNGYVFLLKNASMMAGTDVFTGLGGDRQVMILKSVDRYYRADSGTPKSGLSMVMIHELGHNLGFPHSFANYDYYYAGDFSFDVMGYYPYAFNFNRLKTDLYQRAYGDILYAEVVNALVVDRELYDSQNKSILIDELFSEIDNRITQAGSLFDQLRFLDTLNKLFDAQGIEAYLRELLSGIIPIGDIDHDGIVDITDAAKIGIAWQSQSGEPSYDFFADLNHDDVIDISDAAVVGINWQVMGKVKVAFFRWATGNRTVSFDYVANVYADWATTEKNITYGFWNWDNTALQCSVRIRNITYPDNLLYFRVKIYNQTKTVLDTTWNTGNMLPSNWVSLSVAAHSKYFVYVEFMGAPNPPAWWSRITIETKINTP